MLPDLILSPMRRVFFGVGATLYSFTLSQSFWQVTMAIALSTEITTATDYRLNGGGVELGG